MKILVVSPYLPHPQSGHGGGTYLYGLISHLSNSHEVSLVSFADRREQELSGYLKNLPISLHLIRREKGQQKNTLVYVHLAALRAYQLIRSLVLWEPYYASKFRHRKMTKLIGDLTSKVKFDVVQIEFAQMGVYLRYIRSGKTILHDHDIAIRTTYRQYKRANSVFKRMLMFIEWSRWISYYSQLISQFDHVITITEQDEMLLRKLTHITRTSYLPTGIETPQEVPRNESRRKHSLLFIGTFSHQPNLDAAVWLCEEIFPLVQEQFPEATLFIIGSNPPSILENLARKGRGIKIIGFVRDVVPYLQECAVFVAPLRFGGGVKMKLLHAMAQGIPVVTTRIGTEGIEGIRQGGVLVGNSTERLARHICALFQDSSQASEVGRKGREIILQSYSWDRAHSRLEEIYKKILASTAKTV